MKIKERIKEKVKERKRILISLGMLVLATLVGSLTIGRSLYLGKQPGLIAFSLVNFAGYLFFFLMPVEVLIPFYVAEGHAGLLLIILAISTAIAAQLIDYAIGYLASEKIIFGLIGEKKYQKAEKHIHAYGGWAILVFNLFPLSSSLLSLAAGMVRFNFKKFIVFSIIGLIIKYVALVYFFGLF